MNQAPQPMNTADDSTFDTSCGPSSQYRRPARSENFARSAERATRCQPFPSPGSGASPRTRRQVFDSSVGRSNGFFRPSEPQQLDYGQAHTPSGGARIAVALLFRSRRDGPRLFGRRPSSAAGQGDIASPCCPTIERHAKLDRLFRSWLLCRCRCPIESFERNTASNPRAGRSRSLTSRRESH